MDQSLQTSLLMLNGPNLGRLGQRRPELYGSTTLAQLRDGLREHLVAYGVGLVAEQYDGEGELIRCLDAHRDVAGAIVNPGALMMYGYSLRDALEDFPAPWIEVHLSNVWARETFRHDSVLSAVATGVIAGLGIDGYYAAADALMRRLGKTRS